MTQSTQPVQGSAPFRSMMDLRPLFEADSIALVGASERMAYSRAIDRNLRQLGFPMQRFYPVNPNRPQVFGRPSYPSLADVPDSVALAIIVTGAQSVAGVMRQCAEKRVDAALVLTDGFAESGPEGRALQEEIAEIAREASIRLIGPNCFGFVSPTRAVGAWAGDLPASLRPGNVAAVFQSSGMLNLFLTLASDRRVGFHLAATAGNQAVLTTGDYLWHAVNEDQVTLIVTVVESIVEPEPLLAALDRAADLGKPVIMLRVGRSERGQRNALAHTGNLVGPSAAWDALLRQKGVVLVEDHDELLEATVLFSACKAGEVRGDGVGLVTISGGDCSLVCDLAEREGVSMPDLTPATQAVLVDALDKPTLLGNPLDVENLLKQDETAFYRCLDAFVRDPGLSLITARLNLPSSVTPEMRQAYAHLAHAAAEHHKQAVFFSRASEPLSSEWLDLFEELDVPLLKEYRKGLRTLRRFIEYGAFLERRRSTPLVETGAVFDVDEGCARASLMAGSAVLGYRATVDLLASYGIPVAPAWLVSSVEDACAAARELGWPVALKVASPDIPHKSDVGALALDLADDSDVEAAYARILDKARGGNLGASIEGVVVQAMVRGGTETIVGLSVDPRLGPVVMFGLGGVYVEVLRDVALRVGPLTRAEAHSLISEVRGAALLRGARGRPPGDEEALIDVLVRVARLGYDLRDTLAELDLNPLLVLPRGEGVLALDALAVRR